MTSTRWLKSRSPVLQRLPGDFDVNDLQIPLGDSAVPRFSSQQLPQDIGFIQLSINEIFRLRRIVGEGMSEAQMAFHMRWSKWRRKHQAIARWYHRRARLTVASELT
ncbi:MAG TPA: hypothetical protein VMV92_08045 [Streptosporangiaceae bacterium]|nr:hypothetical protein [Streptosporangiaceae bacterium]